MRNIAVNQDPAVEAIETREWQDSLDYVLQQGGGVARAAELLRAGKHNVTEAAFEVGYSSLSHFSQAFHETFGVCPGLYPILPLTQRHK